jgi:hypothetical protein
MMPVLAMGMAVGDFFCGGGTHAGDGAGKHECNASQRMVAIDHHLVVGDIGNGEQRIVIFTIFAAALELHADFYVFRKQLTWLDGDEFGVVIAKCVFGFEFHFQGITLGFALKFFFNSIENATIAAMQIDQRCRRCP